MIAQRERTVAHAPNDVLTHLRSPCAGKENGGDRKELRRTIRVLLVTRDAADFPTSYTSGGKLQRTEFCVTTVSTLSTALEHLAANRTDVVLLDLASTEPCGFGGFNAVQAAAPNVPIVVLITPEEETLAVRVLEEGASDYLLKGHMDGHLLLRCLYHAVERHELQAALGSLDQDSLTGLYTRRSFLLLAEQYLRWVERSRGLAVVFFELGDFYQDSQPFKLIRQRRMLVQFAKVLQKAFRCSDILCRWEEHQFAVLAIDISFDQIDRLTSRLAQVVNDANSRKEATYRLTLSMGLAYCRTRSEATVGELLSKADGARRRREHILAR